MRPIFIAHCVRCHGADDMLHSMLVYGVLQAPHYCYLQGQENEGDCTNLVDPACKQGAGSALCTVQIPARVVLSSPSAMPPPPSDPLTDGELEVINRWKANQFAQ